MATEITEQSTTEEVQQYAEQVAQEVAQERAGTKKDDVQIVNEHADNEHKTVVEKPSDDVSADEGEITGESEDQAQSWLDDDMKAEAAAYGINESEIADFASREEFERALRLFDKTALEAGRKAMAEGQPRNEQGKFEKKEESPAPKEGAFEITLDKDEYDEALVAEFTRMRDHYESRLEALESRFVEADAIAAERHFDTLVDSLGHDDLFGKTGKEDAKQLQRREDLLIAVRAQQIGLEMLGRPTELNESLVNRVARMAFAEELGKKDLKSRTRKISKQSNGRQGGGATRATDAKEDPRDHFDRLYKELEGA